MSDHEKDNSIEKLGELIKDIQFAMLTTVDDDGSLRSRPMATQNKTFDGELWFYTHASSPKVHEIEQDQHVNVSYAHPGDRPTCQCRAKRGSYAMRRKTKSFGPRP